MLSAIFTVLLIAFVGKLVWWAIKACWGITKILFYIVFFPVILIAAVVAGFAYIAVPVLVIAGIVAIIKSLTATA